MEQALILHLATTLAALEVARAAAPTASPTWLGLEQVESATRAAVAAAHAVVAGYTASPSVDLVSPPSLENEQFWLDLLTVGPYTFNPSRVEYFSYDGSNVWVHFGKDDELCYEGAEAEALLDWLTQRVHNQGSAVQVPQRAGGW